VNEDIDLLKDFVRQAGRIALDYQTKDLKTQFKPDNQGPVTIADIEIDALANRVLRAARPDYGMLSEETPASDDRLQAKRTFILDPIDGTNAYMEGRRDFTIALAIVENQIPITAAIYAPARDKLYWAMSGQGAWCNTEKIQPSKRKNLKNSKFLGRKNHVKNKLGETGYKSIQWGFRSSLAYRYCLVADGQWDAMLSAHLTYEWDAAAGDLILREAGGTSTDLEGNPLRFNQQNVRQTPGVLGTTPALHENILRLPQINNS